METCPRCGNETANICEGVCAPCWEDVQQELDLHIEEYDRWNRMSDHQRDVAIRRASR